MKRCPLAPAEWFHVRARRFGGLLLPWLLPHLALAQTPIAAAEHGLRAPAVSSSRVGPVDPAEIEAFLDGLLGVQLADGQVAGATVAIVRDGRVLFSGGYGWADVDGRATVDPATTLFRIGSVTKLFTWTAVMQLRDEGRLDLDADVNRYLDFRIPATYPQPITLRHLMTHTPGFEDRAFRLFAPGERMPRGEWLRRNVPARVRPPGEEVAYSNYGSALAGYVVERVSGMPWEEYVEQRILTPLGMESATVRQPLPEPLAAAMSRGYLYRDGRFAAQPFDWVNQPMAPAGAVSASGEAMARFMTAHLQDGRFGDVQLLSDSATHLMHTRAFGRDPLLNGWALGFFAKSSHGLNIVAHGGGTQHFVTDLSLIPSERLGVFVSYNAPGRDGMLARRFQEAFLDHYYPVAPLEVSAPAPGWEERARSYAGSYLPLRRPYTTLDKLAGATQRITAVPGEPGEMILRFAEGTQRVREVAPGFFRTPDGDEAVAFATNARGRLHMYLGSGGRTAERVSAWETSTPHLVLLATSLLLFLSVLVLMPARFTPHRQEVGFSPLRGAERGFRWAALGFVLLSLTFVVAVAVAFTDPDGYVTGSVEPLLRAALILPLLSLPFAAAVIAGAALSFRRRYWTRWGRVHYALVAAAVIVFLLQLHFWNLLGWRF
jgi:CubicO group peptidase (beta-lactamase class C family)